MRWSELELEAPELAALGRERLEAAKLVMLGTIRADGTPRISPVEPFLLEGHLLLGAMTRSAKARDLTRDPRCAVHSIVTAPNQGEGELKLFGRVEQVGDPALRNASDEPWWVPLGDDRALVFSVEIDRAVFVSWDLEGGLMTVRRWSPERGTTASTTSYP
jgi:hypothetical protein